MNDVAIYIISHNRPKCKTAKYISEHSNYDWFIILDDTDKSISEYINNFGKEHICIFNKSDIISNTDTITSDKQPTSAVYVRNFVEQLHKYDYFIVMDDDISNFRFRYVTDKNTIGTKYLSGYDFDNVIQSYIEFMSTSDKINWLCMSTNSVYLNGIKVFDSDFISNQRLGYNIFIRKATNVEWKSLIYEDLITSITQAQNGYFNLTFPYVTFTADEMGKTNDLSGNNYYATTDSLYRSMFCVVTHPSCVRLSCRKNKIVPSTIKDKAFPKLISGRYKNG